MMSDVELRTMEAELMGADAGAGGGGLDTSFAVSALSELATRGVKTYEDTEAKKKAQQADAAALSNITALDLQYANACADKAVAKPAEVAAKQSVVDQVSAAQNALAVKLSANAATKRVEAASDAARKAADAWSAKPGDKRLEALSKCWNDVVTKASMQAANSGASPQALEKAKGGGPSFLERKVGPLPVWGWGLVAVGGTGALIGIAKLFGGKRRRR